MGFNINVLFYNYPVMWNTKCYHMQNI